jgi:hypothetical protein
MPLRAAERINLVDSVVHVINLTVSYDQENHVGLDILNSGIHRLRQLQENGQMA